MQRLSWSKEGYDLGGRIQDSRTDPIEYCCTVPGAPGKSASAPIGCTPSPPWRLTWFIEYPHGPLVRRIPVGEGRRVETFVHLLSPAAPDGSSGTVTPSAAADTPAENDWRAAIEARLASLEAVIAELKAGQAPRSVDGNP